MRFLTRNPITLPALLIMIMSALLISGSIRVFGAIRDIQDRSTENYTWLFSQAEYELNRLRIAAEAFGMSNTGPTVMQGNFDAFDQAFGIYYSRIESLKPAVRRLVGSGINSAQIEQDFARILKFRDDADRQVQLLDETSLSSLPLLLTLIAETENLHREFVVGAVGDIHFQNASAWTEFERFFLSINTLFWLLLAFLCLLSLWLGSMVRRLRLVSLQYDFERRQWLALVDAAPYALVLCSSNDVILHANAAASRLLCKDCDILSGLKIETLIAVCEPQSSANRQSTEVRWRTTVALPEMPERQVEMSRSVMSLPGNRDLRLFGIRDIENELRLEASMIEARTEATEARKSRMRFVEVLNHEIRTPLQELTGLLELRQPFRKFDDLDRVAEALASLSRRVEYALSFASGQPTKVVNGAGGTQLVDVRTADAVCVRRSVLVVEDHDANRRLVCEMIRKEGHQVFDARTGEAAVEMALTRHFDVVIMDLALPGMDGIAAMRSIRAVGLNASLSRFIAFSAHMQLIEEAYLSSIGFELVLRKPVLRHQLASAIDGVHLSADTAYDSVDWIDTEQFDAIQETVAEGEITRLVAGLFCEVEEICRFTQAWLQGGDASVVESHAHRTAGLAAMLGAAKLAQGLYKLEDAASRRDMQAVTALTGSFKDTTARTQQKFAELISVRTAVQYFAMEVAG